MLKFSLIKLCNIKKNGVGFTRFLHDFGMILAYIFCQDLEKQVFRNKSLENICCSFTMSNFDLWEKKKNRQKTVKKRPKTTKGTYSLYRLYAITLRQFKFFTFLAHVPYFKAVFLYTLPEPSGILSECHILPIPDSIYI